jgi:hypothetical protein
MLNWPSWTIQFYIQALYKKNFNYTLCILHKPLKWFAQKKKWEQKRRRQIVLLSLYDTDRCKIFKKMLVISFYYNKKHDIMATLVWLICEATANRGVTKNKTRYWQKEKKQQRSKQIWGISCW